MRVAEEPEIQTNLERASVKEHRLSPDTSNRGSINNTNTLQDVQLAGTQA